MSYLRPIIAYRFFRLEWLTICFPRGMQQVRLTTRVETVREVLEKFLDDDEDMHDLNLTANEVKEIAETEPEVRM